MKNLILEENATFEEIIPVEDRSRLARLAYRRATGRELADMARSTSRDSFDFDECIFVEGEWTDDEIIDRLAEYCRAIIAGNADFDNCE